jgi:hypothetical protein
MGTVRFSGQHKHPLQMTAQGTQQEESETIPEPMLIFSLFQVGVAEFQ